MNKLYIIHFEVYENGEMLNSDVLGSAFTSRNDAEEYLLESDYSKDSNEYTMYDEGTKHVAYIKDILFN